MKKGEGKRRGVALLAACLLPGLFLAACSPASPASSSAGSASLPTVVVQAPVPVSSAPPQSLPPQSEAPAAPPEFQFTDEELTRLATMLDEWAEKNEESEENGHNVAVYFKDIGSGLTYQYNPDKVFMVASLNKAPYAMYLYHLVATGQASMEETFLVTPEMMEKVQDNSGELKKRKDLPRDFTMGELMSYLLRYSDTAALKVLLERYGATGYTAYMQELGVPTGNIRNVSNGRITAPEAGSYLDALYNFMQSGEYGAALQQELSNTNFKMVRTAYPYVGKYGWDENAYHDMAIISAPHPYAIAILTDKDEGTWAEMHMFTTIARTFEEIMEQKWATVG